jgi:hypothetical protein
MVMEVYKMIISTNHLKVSNGNDLMTSAAMSTATIPGIAIPNAAFLLYAPDLINL